MKKQDTEEKDLTLMEVMKRFSTEEAARTYLEEILWPTGKVCPHCKNAEQTKIWAIAANPEKKIRAGLNQCGACKKQFTVTVGTIFEDSHIPLNKWLLAWYLMCASKKGVSSLQLQRILELGSYRTALFMTHRIRHSLKSPVFQKKLTGTVEVDEAYIGGKQTGKGHKVGKQSKTAVVAMVERGGNIRSQVLKRVTSQTLTQAIRENVEICSRVMTDHHKGYVGLKPKYDHESVKHSAKEYGRGDVNVNTAESAFSLFKRGVVGTFHSISPKYLPLYLAEFDHRWNYRKDTDGQRTIAAIKCATGKRMTYKPLKAIVEAQAAEVAAEPAKKQYVLDLGKMFEGK